jgi:glycosyltransferase involved in cell wall biosynthesis
VVVGNDTLAAWAEQHCDDVRVIPTCIEPADYVVRASWEIEDGPPVIGWIGSPATEHYLGLVSDALAETHRRTGAVLRIISGPGSVPPALEPFATRSIWTPESTRDIAGWDLGIMPLSDGVYERAKCGYKLLQYAASGVPVVGSPVGVNEQLIADMDGLAPCAPDEWTDALIELINDPDTRRGERAQRGLAVAERFSYSVWEQRWIDAVGW